MPRKPPIASAARQFEDIASRPASRPPRTQLFPSGSTLLNLACADDPYGAYPVGTYTHLVGDSHSGKTLLALTGLACAHTDSAFRDWDLHYRDVEAALNMDIAGMFGSRFAKRLQLGGEQPIETVQDVLDELYRLCKLGRPFAYVLDSWDALTSKEEVAVLEGADKGSMGMEKAKYGSATFRNLCRHLKASGGHLMIVSQTRDNINAGTFAAAKRYSGGRALKFYASHQVWLAVKGALTKEVNKRKRVIGNACTARVAKSKYNGKVRDVDFLTYYDYGVDDVGANVDFLVREKRWSKSGQSIDARGELGGVRGTRKSVIDQIESEGRENELADIVADKWDEIEATLALGRKGRFS